MSDLLHRNGRRLARLGHWQFVLRPRLAALWAVGVLALALLAAAVLPLGPFETLAGGGTAASAPASTAAPATSAADAATGPAVHGEAETEAETLAELRHMIWRDFRLPRILAALLVGAMLGLAGAALQTLARNELADPGLVGVKEGAAVAVIAVALLAPQLASGWRTAAGLAGGLAVALLVAALSRDLTRVRFILVGIGVSWLLHAAIAIFTTTADLQDVQTALIWMAGSLHAASWPTLAATAPWAAVGLLLLLASSRAADVASLGPGVAAGLGVNLRRLHALRLLAACLLTAAAVAAVGSLGFVGLVAPHLSRLSLGGRQLALLAGSGLYGAALVLAADSIGRLAFAPLQIPAGIVMAIIGVPVLLALLWRRRDQL
ncbi:MAG: iron ABC transporter permease [Comamonas sp.]